MAVHLCLRALPYFRPQVACAVRARLLCGLPLVGFSRVPAYGPTFMNAEEFHSRVYEVVRMIPYGHVTSYGHVAKLIGQPRHSRHVGQALKFLPGGTDVPWQRVLAASGQISSRGPGTEGAERQKDALETEGVEVIAGLGGIFRVDLREFGWFPEQVELET